MLRVVLTCVAAGWESELCVSLGWQKLMNLSKASMRGERGLTHLGSG